MAMTEALHALAAVTAIKAKIVAAHVGTGLGLKVVQAGDMTYISVKEGDLATFLPAVMIRPVSEAFNKGTQGPNGKWFDDILFRVVYVAHANVTGSEDMWATKMDAAQKLVCTLLDAFLLSNAVLTNGSIYDTRIERVEYIPGEEVFIREFKGDIYCVAIDYRVVVEGVRNNP